jgi:hypothetical protein
MADARRAVNASAANIAGDFGQETVMKKGINK